MLRAGFARLSGALNSGHLVATGGDAALELQAREKALGKTRVLEGGEDDNQIDEAMNKGQFDFERMVGAFEAVTFPKGDNVLQTRGGLPHTQLFLSAMSEVILLFDHLGSAFAFVRRDIQSKTTILRGYADERPKRFHDLEFAVRAEVAEGVADSKPPPSAARTLLRLMWALRFIDVLLNHLREALRPGTRMPTAQRTLRAAASEAYERALAEHHSWALRRTVRAALTLLPSMDTFVSKIGARPEHLERLKKSMTPIVDIMYRFYGKENLLELP